ncbi:MAG: hypothetical protein QOF48_3690 [Verrucomicrobiota bacterium]|jgi:hypothetical protein
MKRHRTSDRWSAEPIEEARKATAERVKLNHELLIAMAHALDGIEKTQRKFRTVVLLRLSRIETMLQMIHGAQIVEAHLSKPACEEKASEHAEAAETYISEHSRELGLKMVRFIYGESEEPMVRRDRRRKWSDWEI